MKSKRPLLILLAIAILGLHLSNIWRLHTYPFTDLPNHLAEAYLLRTLTINPTDSLGSYYRLDFAPYTPAILHAVFCALFPDIEIGNKIFYSLYILILSGSLWLLIRSARGDLWLGLMTCLFFYSLSVRWGFASFTMGIGLVFLNLFFLIRLLEKPSWLRSLVLGISMAGLYYAHVMVWTMTAVVVVLSLISYRKSHARLVLPGLISLTPGLVLFGLYLRFSSAFNGQASLLSGLPLYYLREYLPSFPKRLLAFLINDNRALAAGISGTALGLLFSLLVLANLAALSLIWARGPGGKEQLPSRRVSSIFLITSLAFFFLLPLRLPGQDVVYPRFSVFVYLGAIWALSYKTLPSLRSLLYGLFLPLVILHATLWSTYFNSFNRLAQPFYSLLHHAESAQGRTLGALIENYRFRGEPAFMHYQNYQIIWNQGAVPTNMTEYRYRLVEAQSEKALPHYEGWITGEADIKFLLASYQDLELLICQGEHACSTSLETHRYTIANQQGDWMLLTPSGAR